MRAKSKQNEIYSVTDSAKVIPANEHLGEIAEFQFIFQTRKRGLKYGVFVDTKINIGIYYNLFTSKQ